MKLEADRPRLDVANACQEQSGEQVLVREPFLELGDRDLEGPLARGFLEQPHHRLNFGPKRDHFGLDLGLLGTQGCDGSQAGPRAELAAQAQRGGKLKKSPPAKSLIHGWSSLFTGCWIDASALDCPDSVCGPARVTQPSLWSGD